MPSVVAGRTARDTAPVGIIGLPSVNTRITLSPRAEVDPQGGGAPIEARTIVEDLRHTTGRRQASVEVVVAQPSFAGDLDGETPGRGYLLRWTTRRGIHEVVGSYVDREQIGPRLIGWRLHVSGPVSHLQRRAYARVDVTVPVHVMELDESGSETGVVRGYSVNVSEGGALVSLDGPSPAVGAPVVVRFGLGPSPQETFVLSGRVVRHQSAAGPRAGVFVAVSFDAPEVHGDRLRPLLFAHQVRARWARR